MYFDTKSNVSNIVIMLKYDSKFTCFNFAKFFLDRDRIIPLSNYSDFTDGSSSLSAVSVSSVMLHVALILCVPNFSFVGATAGGITVCESSVRPIRTLRRTFRLNHV